MSEFTLFTSCVHFVFDKVTGDVSEALRFAAEHGMASWLQFQKRVRGLVLQMPLQISNGVIGAAGIVSGQTEGGKCTCRRKQRQRAALSGSFFANMAMWG